MIEVTTFEAANGVEYVVYSPVDPLIFLGIKGEDGWELCVDEVRAPHAPLGWRGEGH